MKTLLICIARRENAYINEFVNYYKNLGVDNIVICDNNFDGEETFDEVLKDDIESGFVIIENVRNLVRYQIAAYNSMFNKYKDSYDWIMFFDCDEFLSFKNNENIKDFLSDNVFQNFDVIKVNWMLYDDNDLLFNDGRPMLERFSRPCDFEVKGSYYFSENYHVKSIIHSAIYKPNILFGTNMHSPAFTINTCDCEGNSIRNTSPFNPYNFNKAWLKHFSWKTATEFVERKFIISTPDVILSDGLRKRYIDIFFKINKKTPEKVEIFKSHGISID